jgi:mannose-6-phosphate isomerase-like protein (cupin superfamily)
VDRPLIVEKPWGYEQLWAVTDQYVGKLLHVREGHRLSLQYHRQKDESCYLLNGSIRLLKGSTVDELTAQDLEPGACWRNRPGELHWLEALKDSDILEASTRHLDDVVRVRDDYGRVGANEPAGAHRIEAELALRRACARLDEAELGPGKLEAGVGEWLRTRGRW